MTTATTPKRAKVFMSGRSQAVRLPKAFRLDADEVEIRRIGNGLLISPVNQNWAMRMRTAFAALEQMPGMERPQDWPQSEREELWP